MIKKRFRLPVLFLIALLTSQYGAATVALPPEYNRWISEDVRWIISAQEKEAFLKLATNEERDHFVVEFWERRNPNPGGKENLFKEEHYRRLAFSNDHFAAKLPGWETDRGHVYIVYGPPDSIDKYPSAGSNPPEEVWNYRRMPGAHSDVSLRFVDRCACGDYGLRGNLPNSN
jgi:GWxTD domain-containing protein